VGIALHLIWPSFDAEVFRTGGLRALGLTLSPSAKVFKLPDMTAESSIFQGSCRGEKPLHLFPHKIAKTPPLKK
jgi:hypothetical protein